MEQSKMTQPHRLQRTADDDCFAHYLRTGERFTMAQWHERERKFNSEHDERGRFTFSARGVALRGDDPLRMAERRVPPQPPAGQNRSSYGRVRIVGVERDLTVPIRPIAEIPGYPQNGRTSWRSSNDLIFAAAADHYNHKYNLKPEDQGFRTPEFMKAWAMRESGGEGNRDAFLTDPFQVNNPGDWPRDNAKALRLGLRKGQLMTPASSAQAALEWLRYKAAIHDTSGRIMGFRSNREALERYNAAPGLVGGVARPKWYAETILQMANQATRPPK
jgi:hypothetical protein